MYIGVHFSFCKTVDSVAFVFGKNREGDESWKPYIRQQQKSCLFPLHFL